MLKSKVLHYFVWAIQILLGALFLFGGYMKVFTNDPQTAQAFQRITEVFMVGPWFRYFTGVWELIVGVTIMIPGLWGIGARMGVLVMLGASVVNLSAAGVKEFIPFTLSLAVIFFVIGLYRVGLGRFLILGSSKV